MEFNKEQLMAINCSEGIYGVQASAGSGKTTLMVERCRRLVKEERINPKKILITTFTNSSAKDLKKKLTKVDCEDVETGTFHSVCQRVLLSNGINAFNTLPEYVITNEFRKIVDKPKTKDILSWIGYQKNYGIKPNGNFAYKESDYEEHELRQLYNSYENLKNKSNCLDFEDWLLIAIDLLKQDNEINNQFKYDYIMVDEHQDSNKLQLELIKLFCPKNNIFMVFDEKQQLYGFRGSDSDFCLHIEKYFQNIERFYVSTNYRSCKNIVEYSNNFARKYYGEFDSYKDAIPYIEKDGNIKRLNFIDKEEEGAVIAEEIKSLLENGIKPNEIAVLYRNNKDVFSLENELKILGVPYFLTNTSNNFFNRKEISFILSILRLIENTNDDDAFEIAFNSRLDGNLKFLSKDIKEDFINIGTTRNISLFDSFDLVRCAKPWQLNNIKTFKEMIFNLQLLHKNNTSLSDIINKVIKLTKIKESIEEKANSNEELEEKLQSLEDLKSFVRNNILESFLRFVYSSNKSKKKLDKNSIVLSTFHGSKGLEWDNVFLIGLNEKYPNLKKCNSILDEVNTFFVATTRSKRNLTLSEIGYNQFVEEYFDIK